MGICGSPYIDILKQSYFWASTGRTLYFTVVSVAAEFVIVLGVALLLSQNFKLRGFLRVMLILPWALPTVVNGVLWSWIFNTSYGSLNGLLLEAASSTTMEVARKRFLP
jgi:ABC-type sugar transport system permease subunit